MIIRALVVVTMNGAPIRNGAVRIRGDRIAEVGPANAFGNEQTIVLDQHALLPGLINAHCHLDYTCLRGKIRPRQSFTQWIRAINAEKAKLDPADFSKSIRDGIAEALRFGTTSLVNFEAYPELIRNFETSALRIWWCAELIDVNRSKGAAEIVADAEAARPRSMNRFGLAPHAPFTASAELYERSQRMAEQNTWRLSTHLAESREEMEMFSAARGELFEFLQQLGRDMRDCGGTTPLEWWLRAIDATQAGEWIVAHLNELAEPDFELLAELSGKFSVAHCPRSHAYFEHSAFAFERLRGLGANICLGTDSLASNADLSLLAELRALRFSNISARQKLELVTTNAARALGMEESLGRIAPGFFADLIAIPITSETEVFEQIVAFESEVPFVVIGSDICQNGE